eukprot:5994349-Amphidinium_carterae.1
MLALHAVFRKWNSASGKNAFITEDAFSSSAPLSLGLHSSDAHPLGNEWSARFSNGTATDSEHRSLNLMLHILARQGSSMLMLHIIEAKIT